MGIGTGYWHIIITPSSGFGWALKAEWHEHFINLDVSLNSVSTKCFTSSEAKVFMEANEIDETKWNSQLLPVTSGNPLLLHCFKNSKHHADGMQKGLLHIKSIMDAFLETLVERMTQEFFILCGRMSKVAVVCSVCYAHTRCRFLQGIIFGTGTFDRENTM